MGRLLTILLVTLLSVTANAQFIDADRIPLPEEVVAWTVTGSTSAEGVKQVEVRADIREGWSVYGMNSAAGRPLLISVDSVSTGSLRPFVESGTRDAYDPNFESEVTYFTSESVASAIVDSDSEVFVSGTLTYMTCDDTVCLPPSTEEFQVSVQEEGSEGIVPGINLREGPGDSLPWWIGIMGLLLLFPFVFHATRQGDVALA